VVKQASLQFCIAPRPHAEVSTEDVSEAMGMLVLALEYLGAGAKTATGYGRFEIDSNATIKQEKAQKEAQRNIMTAEDRFADELIDINEKKLAEMFGKKYNKTKRDYEEKGCDWDEIIAILIAQKRMLIESWSQSPKDTAQEKAYKKLKLYLT
jgi:hypothetical protein